MDSMIQILEGLETQDERPCPCKRNLAGATVTQEGDTGPLVVAGTPAPAASLFAAALLLVGGFSVDRLRRKK